MEQTVFCICHVLMTVVTAEVPRKKKRKKKSKIQTATVIQLDNQDWKLAFPGIRIKSLHVQILCWMNKSMDEAEYNCGAEIKWHQSWISVKTS